MIESCSRRRPVDTAARSLLPAHRRPEAAVAAADLHAGLSGAAAEEGAPNLQPGRHR
jgi:hypothetical protein